MTLEKRGRFRRITLGVGLSMLVLLGSASPAAAASLYADNACAFDGNGLANRCAASNGGSGARNSGAGLQSLLDASACGDTIFIKPGREPYTNVLHGGEDYADLAYFTVHKSCSEAAPLTIRGLDPADKPVLCQNSTCTQTGNDKGTIAVTGSAYVKIQYLTVSGAVFIEGARRNQPGMEVSYLDISGGARCDGNYSLLYVDDSRVWIHHNFLHDLYVNGCEQKAGLRMFGPYGSVVEYNTIVEGHGVPMERGGLDLKDCTANVTVRFNVIRGGGRVNSQDEACQPGSPLTRPASGNRIYGNIYVVSGAQQMTADMTSPLEFYNNTVVAGALDWYGDPDWGPITGSTVHDNLVIHGGYSHSSAVNVNVGISQESWPFRGRYSWDYNVYSADSRYYGNGSTYDDLGSWRAASGLDAHSTALSCSFVQTTDPSAVDYYKIAPGTSCVTSPNRMVRVEAGAYGVTSCVGRFCTESGSSVKPGREGTRREFVRQRFGRQR